MEYWEFLLQKEGDNSWLPLESSQVEILEGRYRVMAHTSQVRQPVQVRISQLLLHHSPPKRRSLKRTSQTRENGLMVVIPFTWLTAGIWEIECSQPTNPAETETGWRYGVQLRVLPQDSEEDGDWFADDGELLPGQPTPATADPARSQLKPADYPAEIAPVPAQQPLSPAALDQLWAAVETGETTDAVATAPVSAGFQWCTQLSQSALVGSKGQTLTLAGQILPQADAPLTPYPGGHIVLRLFDPQSGQPVLVSQQALAAGISPVAFAVEVSIPAQLDTRLLLGEVLLAQVQEAEVDLQAIDRFTITVDLADLFDVIANQAESQPDLDVVFPVEFGDTGAESSQAEANSGPPSVKPNPNLPQPPPRAIPAVTLPKAGIKLPPRIYYPSPHEVAAHQPVLPPLANQTPIASLDEVLQPPSTDPIESTPASRPEPETTPTAAAIPTPGPVSLPPFVKTPSTSASPSGYPPSTDHPSSSIAAAGSAQVSPPALPSHEEAAFRSLNLQARFWTRLNELAADIQQSVQDQRATTSSPELIETETLEPPGDSTPELETSFPGEVVIYEGHDATVGSSPAEPNQATIASGEPNPDPDPVSPPVPDIELPEGDLTAGESVLLSLRVPFHPNRLYLKIWMTDPQTRTLADEPRQLMHLAPDGHGFLTGNIQLTVPPGCLEVWFEAISVDMITQQESYKASVMRPVKPADLPDADLDDFEI